MTGPFPCQRCHKTVTWARSRAGRRILMDFHPAPLGDYCIVGTDHPYRIVAKLQNKPEGAKRYMCHFDTCPNDSFRRRRPTNAARKAMNARFKREWDKRALEAA